MARDTVTVPREPTEIMLEAARDWPIAKFHRGIGDDAAIGCWRAMHDAYLASPPSSDPEGGARGEADALHHLGNVLAILAELHPDDRSNALDGALAFYNARCPNAQVEPVAGVSRLVHQWPGPSDQLTKTPSADHDGCICQNQHRRGYCNEPGCQFAPNHQPHAVSQGWQDIETAPRDGTRILLYTNEIDPPTIQAQWKSHHALYESGEWVDVWNNDPIETNSGPINPTHWMPLPAPPSPAKTGGAE